MAFHHLSGATTYGAADEVLDWFSTFEAWITTVVGWNVVSGSGTKNIVLRSVGEVGTLGNLYVRIWESAAGIIRGEVRNAAGDHITNEGGEVHSQGVQFRYWMTADLDCIIIVVPDFDRDRVLYLGRILPMPNTPTNEFVSMVASDDQIQYASILQNSAGVWDVDITNRCHAASDNIHRCAYDGSFAPFALYAEQGNTCAGQYKYISGQIGHDMAVTPHDEFTSAVAGATSRWMVFYDGVWKFAMMIEAGQPGNVSDGAHFAYQTGVSANAAAFIATLIAFMTAIGWTDLGNPGLHTVGRLFHSTGESGTEDIYVIVAYEQAANSYWHIYVQDDAAGTHRTADAYSQFNMAEWPGTYRMAADRDCICLAWSDSFNRDPFLWGGRCEPLCQGLPSEYNMATAGRLHSIYWALRSHDGVWNQVAEYTDAGAIAVNSNANAYDPSTYTLWPQLLVTALPGSGNPRDPVGWLRYAMYTNGGGIARGDTITVGAQTYRVMATGAGGVFWAIRTV